MDFELPREIYERGKVIQVDETKNVHIIIGENSSGKSKLMDVVKNKIGVNKVKIIAENINSIENINAIDKEEVHKRSYRGKGVEQIVSLVNANDTIRTLIFHWFEKLFNKKIKKEGSQYQITENGKNYPLNLDGDGYKCFFNLIYYLITPTFTHLVFDEPERFLHPNLQISLFNMVKKLSKDYDKQIFFITHNQNFIDLFCENVEVILLSKSKSQAFNISNLISGSGQSFRTWIHFNKHILFSKAVVLLEGYSDQLFLNHLISRINHTAFARNISFVSVAIVRENGGKSKIPEYQKILSQFLNCWSIFDFDLLLGAELDKYITNPLLNSIKDLLRTKTIANKNTLRTYYTTTGNDIDIINEVILELKTTNNVLVLSKGEMEHYCKKVGTNKLSDKIYEEVDHISTKDLERIKADYLEIIKLIEDVDGVGNSEHTDFNKILFELIMNFYRDSQYLDPYNFGEIDTEIKDHLMQDPNHVGDDKYRFKFKFISEKEFVIPKDATDMQKRDGIESTLSD